MNELNILVERYLFEDTYTIGKLYIDGVYLCDTLEDKDRMLTSDMKEDIVKNIKVHGRTAIGSGVYKVDMKTISPKFSKYAAYKSIEGKLPRLEDVIAFDGILIHIGNKHEDTEGCLLVGTYNGKGIIEYSTKAFNELYSILKKADNEGKNIYIQIVRV